MAANPYQSLAWLLYVDLSRDQVASGFLPWEFEKDGRELKVRVEGRLVFNNTNMALEAALAGFGGTSRPSARRLVLAVCGLSPLLSEPPATRTGLRPAGRYIALPRLNQGHPQLIGGRVSASRRRCWQELIAAVFCSASP
jgi:hypothetical protein